MVLTFISLVGTQRDKTQFVFNGMLPFIDEHLTQYQVVLGVSITKVSQLGVP